MLCLDCCFSFYDVFNLSLVYASPAASKKKITLFIDWVNGPPPKNAILCLSVTSMLEQVALHSQRVLELVSNNSQFGMARVFFNYYFCFCKKYIIHLSVNAMKCFKQILLFNNLTYISKEHKYTFGEHFLNSFAQKTFTHNYV